MKLAFVADVHVGNHRRHGGPMLSGLNDRCRLSAAVLDAARRRAAELDAEFFVLGDLFDSSRPEPQVVAAVQRALLPSAHVLLGNHDMVSTARGDHALGPLDGYEGISVYESPQVLSFDDDKVEVIMVPFQPGPAAEWLPQVMERLSVSLEDSGRVQARVLCLHLGIIDENTPPWLRGADDAVPLELVQKLSMDLGCDAVLAGNWHSRQFWLTAGRYQIMQVGTLCPTGWDNPGLEDYGTLAVFDSETGLLSHTEIPGPRFVKLRAGQQTVGSTFGNQIYVQMVAGTEERQQSEAVLSAQRDKGRIVGYEVVPDDLESETAARSAAFAARSSETFDQALAAFVREMPLEDGVEREHVLSLSRKYIEGA